MRLSGLGLVKTAIHSYLNSAETFASIYSSHLSKNDEYPKKAVSESLCASDGDLALKDNNGTLSDSLTRNLACDFNLSNAVKNNIWL